LVTAHGRRLIVVHRWGGRPDDDFYPWLRRRLSRMRPAPFDEVRVPVMPNPDRPTIDEWVGALDDVIGRPTPALARTILLGHSVGAQAVLRWLAKLPAGASVEGALLVAGWFAVDEPWPEIVPWCETPLDLPRIRRAAPRIVTLLSDDDPFTKDHAAQAALFESRLGAEVKVIGGAAHFNGEEEPAVEAALLEELAR
jgi:predicted alpha/beta hydrolase family esterase